MEDISLSSIAYALLAGILPALLWLWFWLKEDNLHPEPRLLVALSFIGGCISVIAAIALEEIVEKSISDEIIRYISWAAIEELVKFGAIAIIALRTRYLDEPIDAMIYCITAALGFAALENTLFVLNPIDAGDITRSIITGNLRFIGATLVHVVCSSVIGFMIGLTFYKKTWIKIISALSGVILAIALHASFNLAIISTSPSNTLKIFGWVWCAIIILIILFEEIKGIKRKAA